MKILLAIFILSISSQAQPIWKNYVKARTLAIEYTKNATNNAPSEMKPFFQRIHEQISNSRLIIPIKGQSYQTCYNSGAIAYVLVPTNGKLYICIPILTQKTGNKYYLEYSIERLAQIFIHEAVHMTGHSDECVADTAAVAVMNYGHPKRQAYIEQVYHRPADRTSTCTSLLNFRMDASADPTKPL